MTKYKGFHVPKEAFGSPLNVNQAFDVLLILGEYDLPYFGKYHLHIYNDHLITYITSNVGQNRTLKIIIKIFYQGN